MLEKEITRKQFIFSLGSLFALMLLSGLPKIFTGRNKQGKETPQTPTYGNQAYGGA